MDSGVAWFFFDHGIDYSVPSVEAVSVACSILEDGVVHRPDGLACKIYVIDFVFSNDIAVGFGQSMVMAEVASGGGCTGPFGPASVFLFHVIKGDVGRDFSLVGTTLSKQLLPKIVGGELCRVEFVVESLSRRRVGAVFLQLRVVWLPLGRSGVGCERGSFLRR